MRNLSSGRRFFVFGENRFRSKAVRDLITLKLASGRKQDLADVEHLQGILKG